MTFKIEISSSMTKVNPRKRSKTKSDIFRLDISKSNMIYIDCKIQNNLNEFYIGYLSISLQKRGRNK